MYSIFENFISFTVLEGSKGITFKQEEIINILVGTSVILQWYINLIRMYKTVKKILCKWCNLWI